MIADLMYRLRALFRRPVVESELDEELQLHLAQETEKLVRGGLSQTEARRQAQLSLGGAEQIKEECRDVRGVGFLETTLQDLRYGMRSLRHNPGFAAAAVLTLALGIGASTAVFSAVNAVLLKPLPYPEPERMVFPWQLPPRGVNVGYDVIPWGRVSFVREERETKAFAALGAFVGQSFNLTGSGEPVHADGLRASAGFFPSLGVAPELGRTFTAAEDAPGRGHVVVLSHRLWREQYGANPGILGHSIDLNGESYTVIGVMPAGFDFPRGAEMPAVFNLPRRPQLWVPLELNRGPLVRGEPSELAVVGRLAPGYTMLQAQAELDVFARRMEAEIPRAKGWFTSRVTPFASQITGDTRRPLLLLLGAVGVVLLIACSNVANLLLARSLGRARELTMRAALGAGRRRLLRQLVTESLLLALLGGSGGLAIAAAGIRFVRAFGPRDIPRLQALGFDWRVFAFAFAISLLTGLVFGLIPAIPAARANLLDTLKAGGQRSGDNPAAPRLRSALLVGQISLALVLVIAAGLLLQTFYHLLRADGGFNPEHVLTFELALPPARYSSQQSIVSFYDGALQKLWSLPGVQAAGLAEIIPMGGAGESTAIDVPGYRRTDPKQTPFANYTIASPGYFAAVGTPLLRGRAFSNSDTAGSQPVAIVSRAMVERYWPGQDVIGKQVRIPIDRDPKVIVGVVADVKHSSLREDSSPEMYVPYNQNPWPSMQTMEVAVRTGADPAAMTSSVRAAIQALDPGLPLAKVRTLSSLVNDSMTQPRFSLLLLASFAAIALLLAQIGMYGVVSYSVTQRTREIGIRMALGAPRGRVFADVVAQAARLAAIGIALGLLAALAVARMMAGFLYGVGPASPLTFAAVTLLLVAVALLAAYVPARRASRLDPLIALRCE